MGRYEFIDQLVSKIYHKGQLESYQWRGRGGGAGVILIKSAVSILLEKCSFTMMCHQLGLQHWCLIE